MCDLAVFVNRHTLPSRSVTSDRHREPPRVIVSEERRARGARDLANGNGAHVHRGERDGELVTFQQSAVRADNVLARDANLP